MVRFLLRRILTGAGVVIATAVFAYGGWRALRGDQFPGQSLTGGTWEDLKLAARLQFDVPYWSDGLMADVWMLAGTLLVGMGSGIAAGTWCAAHRGTLRARLLEAAAMVLFCLPPWLAGYGALLLFSHDFGVIRVPVIFDVHVYAEPYHRPLTFLRAMVVPWLIAGLPLFGACLRLTLSATTEALDADFMRTATAKGLPSGRAIRRHARPVGLPTVIAYMSAGAAAVVLNVMMTETVFSVPGLLSKLRKAIGDIGGIGTSGYFDIPTIQLVAIWSAVLIVVTGIVFDIVLASLDPRVRESGLPG